MAEAFDVQACQGTLAVSALPLIRLAVPLLAVAVPVAATGSGRALAGTISKSFFVGRSFFFVKSSCGRTGATPPLAK